MTPRGAEVHPVLEDLFMNTGPALPVGPEKPCRGGLEVALCSSVSGRERPVNSGFSPSL